MAQTDPARVLAALRKNRLRNEVRKQAASFPGGISPAQLQWQQEMGTFQFGQPLPRTPAQFLEGTFTPLAPITPVPVNYPEGDDDRPGPRQRQMPPGWNMPVGQPGTEGFKLASFQVLQTYADVYSVARACIQVRKGEVRGLEWDIMPTAEAEKKMRGDAHAHREFSERKKVVVRFFRKPDPDYLSMGSYIDAVMEEMLVTDALSLYLHPTQKKGGYGPFGKDVASLELISGATIRPLVNVRGGRVRPPSPGYQQYLYGVPRSDLMQILDGSEAEEIKELGKPAKTYRGDQLLYAPYTQRAWTPYGFPPLERTLIPTITGLRKQQYQLDYFDEGTIPGNYISPGEQLGWTPNQLQVWQDQNNALAGDPAWKHKSIALPPGSKVFPMRPVALADQFDEIVMTQVCMGYDVMPMEMGISPKVSTTQSPGAANQMAKATEKTNERKSLKPTLAFLTDIFNLLIQVVWQQEDMRFVFEGLEEDEDENALVERLVQMLQYGLMSVDECRIALGKAPWGLPITSDPVFVSATAGMVPLGSIDPLTGKPMMGPAPAAIGAPPAPGGAAGPPGVGGAPKPAAIPGGSPAPAAGGKPADGTAGKPPPGAAPAGSPGPQPGGGPQNPRDSIHPDDMAGQAKQNIAERHADLQDQLHQDFASGKPMEPPVRPPVSSETEEPDGHTPPRKSSKGMLAELAALTRLTKKRGPDVADTWTCKALPAEVLSYYTGLLKHLSPDDAAAVTSDFIVLCFGPPTLAAQLDERTKTFTTAVPVNATDGQQGLAPYDLDDGSPGVCAECGQPVDGRVHWHDNGGTSDGGPNGVTKAEKTGQRAWPGWRYDLQLAETYSRQLSEALGAALDAREVSAAWLASQRLPVAPVAGKGALGPLAQIAWSWLQSRGYDKPVRDAIQRILTNLWAEGFAVGRESGREMVDSAYDSAFWSRWKPGDPDAARLAAGPGLQKLLQDYGIQTIRSVVQTRMHQLANVLADGFSKGESADEIAKDIEPILRAPQRARMIAVTELARATTQAAVAEYREAGFEGKSWSVTGIPPDNRVCPRCKANGEVGSIPMAQSFPTGDEFTPAHPECRCAILPQELPADTFTTPGVLKWQAGRLKNVLPSRFAAVAPGDTPVEGNPEAHEQVVTYRPRPEGKIDKGTANYRPASVAGQCCATCEMFTGRHCLRDSGQTFVIGTIEPTGTCDYWYAAPVTKGGKEFVAGGLAVRARDTGRVLMIQRAHDEDDPAGGYWEFPGGRLDPGEDVGGAARREWVEETGLPLPAGRLDGTWDSGDYRGHVLSVESEDACPILDREKGTNPDDPDGDSPEAIAWWDPAELKDNPVVRPELRKHPKRVRRALEAGAGKIGKGVLSDLATSLDAHYVDEHNELSDRVSAALKLPTGRVVYEQLLRNYPPGSIEWAKRATWRGPYLVPWDKIDHDDMDSWAASHEPEHVDRFKRKIEDGDEPNPVVLVADPDGNFIDVDGHHRALAYHRLGRPIRAWVGKIDPADRQAMEETHLDQIHEGASLQNKAAVPALLKSWNDAWRHELRGPDGRWIGGGGEAPAPSGAVTFRVRSRGEVHSFDNIYDARDKHDELRNRGHSPKLGYAPGHDARHVSTLAREVLSGSKSRATAMEELAHSAALREKLDGQLATGLASRIAGKPRKPAQPEQPEIRPRSDLLNRYEMMSHDAQDMRNFLKLTSPQDLSSLETELADEYGRATSDNERRKINRLLGGVRGEVDRKLAAQRRHVARQAKDKDKTRRNRYDPSHVWEGIHSEFGDRLVYDGTETADDHLAELESHMPVAFKDALRRFGTVLVATVKSVGGHENDLRTVQPRGWAPGKTFKDVPGAYRPGPKRLVMGNEGGHGSSSLALHEGSHALDHALGYPSSNNAMFSSAYYKLPQDRLRPYYTREGNPGGYLSETFAELGSAWMSARNETPKQRQKMMAAAIGIKVSERKWDGKTMTRKDLPVPNAIAELDKVYQTLLEEVESGKR